MQTGSRAALLPSPRCSPARQLLCVQAEGGEQGPQSPPPSCSARLNTWAAAADVRLDQLRDAPAAQGWGCRDRAVARGLLSTSLPIQQGHEALWDETEQEGAFRDSHCCVPSWSSTVTPGHPGRAGSPEIQRCALPRGIG